MNDFVEQLLKPITSDQPCGPDLSYDARMNELETLLKGKEEVEIGSIVKPAEPPNWSQLKTQAIDFLGACKHLRVAAMLCCSLLKVDGLPGLRDGLQYIRELLERYWSTVHPLLDPNDEDDPQQRLSILSSLTAERNSVTGWIQIIDYLYTTPLCSPRGEPPVTLDDVLLSLKKDNTSEGEQSAPRIDPGILAARFRNASSEEIISHHNATSEAIEAVRGIDNFLLNTLGKNGSISFDVLCEKLTTIENTLSAYMPGTGADVSPSVTLGEEKMQSSPESTSLKTGPVRTREEVVKILDRLCEYYQVYEPASPVPFLLRRAQKLATMNFVQTMEELNLAGPDQLRPSMGSVVDSSDKEA